MSWEYEVKQTVETPFSIDHLRASYWKLLEKNYAIFSSGREPNIPKPFSVLNWNRALTALHALPPTNVVQEKELLDRIYAQKTWYSTAYNENPVIAQLKKILPTVLMSQFNGGVQLEETLVFDEKNKTFSWMSRNINGKSIVNFDLLVFFSYKSETTSTAYCSLKVNGGNFMASCALKMGIVQSIIKNAFEKTISVDRLKFFLANLK